jgi:hypothetical protein
MANPTTNYVFQMPTNTDLVTELPADFEVFGQAVDTQLKALQPGTTLGDIAYSSSTANTNTRLPIGTTGQVLSVSGGVPAWTTPAGGGKVLQVVAASYATEVQNNTGTYADTGLTATITPSSASSTILVLVTQNGVVKSGDTGVGLRLMRGATNIAQIGDILLLTNSALFQAGNGNISYVDSPATTSATTYKTQFNSVNGTSYTRVQNNGNRSSIVLLEIGA